MRTFLVLAIGAIVGSAITIVITDAVRKPRWENITGPVAVISTAATQHGYLGLRFSNEPNRSLIVVENSRPADAAADITPGDRLTAFNRKPLKDFDDLQATIVHTQPGEMAEVTLDRDGQPRTFKLRLLDYRIALPPQKPMIVNPDR